jgi:hypothetical protein
MAGSARLASALGALLVLVGTCTACAGGSPSAGSGGVGSGAPTTTASATPTSRSAGSDTPSAQTRQQLTTECAGGELDLTNTAATPGNYSACVKTGTQVRIRLASVVGTWANLTNSSGDVVDVVNQSISPTGELTAQLRASAQGSSMLTTTSLHSGDPHGPPSNAWSLDLKVQA